MPLQRKSGVFSPVVTPFDRELDPDPERWLSHCRDLLAEDCGLAIFGTNSEANSMSVDERLLLLEILGASDIDPARVMPGIGSCAVPDAVRLGAKAVSMGVAGVLALPPFYYKGVSEDGLYAYFSEIIQRIGDADLRIYLYHIPPVSQVPISLDLIERLKRDYPFAIAGVKDSSGDWNNTRAMIETFEDFDVFAGSEEFLLSTMRAGGAGCISATANVNPRAIVALHDHWADADAEDRQAELVRFRKLVAARPMIPALKAVIAARKQEADWCRVRPPLEALSLEDGRQILDEIARKLEAA